MKKLLLFLVFFHYLTGTLLATHNRSGEMTYRQIDQNTIELTITTYTKISGQSAQADRDRLEVEWGDGSAFEEIFRSSKTLVFNDIQQNIYIGTHAYPGANPIPGQPYVVSM